MNYTHRFLHFLGASICPLDRELWKASVLRVVTFFFLPRLIKNLSAPKTNTRVSLILNNLKQATCSPTFAPRIMRSEVPHHNYHLACCLLFVSNAPRCAGTPSETSSKMAVVVRNTGTLQIGHISNRLSHHMRRMDAQTRTTQSALSGGN